MGVKKEQLRTLSLTDPDLGNSLALADVILAINTSNHEQICLWKRPIEEIAARGEPYVIDVASFTFFKRC